MVTMLPLMSLTVATVQDAREINGRNSVMQDNVSKLSCDGGS